MLRRRPRALALALGLLLAALVLASLRFGSTRVVDDLGSALRAIAHLCGFGQPLAGPGQAIVELRLWRALTAAGVGAALGLSGALVQGIFRNALASPGVIGISGGASLGAVIAVLFVGGYGLRLQIADPHGAGPWLVPVAAFGGALATAFVVYRLASSHGRVSVPALLLIGIAVNTLLAGVQQLAQSLVLDDLEASRAILAWTFGTLDDRAAWHVAVAWGGAAVALCVWPLVAWELDLMQSGLDDAASLGVDVGRVRVLTLVAAALSAAAAVSVAGQIGFVGLIVPHVVRLLSGPGHRTLLPLSALVGAVVLVGADVTQMALFPGFGVQPGVVMSLVGGPFFVWLLWTKRREIAVW
ncbi:MAG: iron ABC transporter permease [Planctomycetota bacterium]|nr:iron ABC transporter permease [Planctomycetota bacterium]